METLLQILERKGLTLKEAAAQLGTTDGHLRRLMRGRTNGSRPLWKRIIVWSGGELDPSVVYIDDLTAACLASGSRPASCRIINERLAV